MLIETWERLRGYHSWNETQAIVESADVKKEPISGSSVLVTTTSVDTLAWNDQTGQRHVAEFTLPDDSPLFKLTAGAAVTIRYNPRNPDHFYLRDLLRTRVHEFFVKLLVWTCLALIAAGYILYAMARSFVRHHTKPLW